MLNNQIVPINEAATETFIIDVDEKKNVDMKDTVSAMPVWTTFSY